MEHIRSNSSLNVLCWNTSDNIGQEFNIRLKTVYAFLPLVPVSVPVPVLVQLQQPQQESVLCTNVGTAAKQAKQTQTSTALVLFRRGYPVSPKSAVARPCPAAVLGRFCP